MRKLFMLFCFVGALFLRMDAANLESVNLGLISQLVELKYVSEAYSARISADSAKTRVQKDSSLINYNEVRVHLDRIIYQLIADMRERNSVKTYKLLNKFYGSHGFSETDGAGIFINSYVLAFRELYTIYRKNILPDLLKPAKDLITPATILSIVDTGWTVLKGVREREGKKVDGITEILNNLRLNPPPELSKSKK